MATRAERFNTIYEEHFEAIRRYAWRRDPDTADDVTAETFSIAWRRLDAVPPDAWPWLIGVARKVRLNVARGRRRQEALAARLHSELRTTSASATDSRMTDAVHAALARLSEKDREVLLLSVWEDLDRAQIARALGCSKSAVSVRLHRARHRLRALLGAAGETDRLHPSALLPGGATDA